MFQSDSLAIPSTMTEQLQQGQYGHIVAATLPSWGKRSPLYSSSTILHANMRSRPFEVGLLALMQAHPTRRNICYIPRSSVTLREGPSGSFSPVFA